MAAHANSLGQCMFALSPRPPVQAGNSLLANENYKNRSEKNTTVQVLPQQHGDAQASTSGSGTTQHLFSERNHQLGSQAGRALLTMVSNTIVLL